MAKNKANYTLSERLPREVASLRRQIREAKTPQLSGADVLPQVTTEVVAVGPFTIAAGGALTFEVTVTPSSQQLTQWNFIDDVYIDVNDEDHRFSDGASLTTAQRAMVKMSWMSFGESNINTNVRTYKTRVRNDDASSHDYYWKVQGILPVVQSVS